MSSTKKITYLALLSSLAIVIGVFESILPAPFPFAPGAKLGLPNLITILGLFTLRKREVWLFIFIRLLVQMLLMGTASTFIYSLAGAVLSGFFMMLVKMLGAKRVSIIGISSIGGFFHNLGQLIVASWIAGTFSVLNYLPILSIIGILCGIVIGIAGNYLLIHIQFLKKAVFLMDREDAWLQD
ncbi:MAG: Gx transporter family protein [Streptococcaceae bacterium]|jgi:heptaprenyl diphosphate synthase|nr:Gx transporter family protein [Streptococcaceae bacterium]